MNYSLGKGVTSDFLEHYGVLGMKWGRRKGRNSKVILKIGDEKWKMGRRAAEDFLKKNKNVSIEEIKKPTDKVLLDVNGERWKMSRRAAEDFLKKNRGLSIKEVT